MTSPAEYEASLCQLEQDPPEIRLYNDNLREEGWTHFSLGGVKFPTATVDVSQRGEALAIFERFAHSLFKGGRKRALEIYRRVDDSTNSYPWSKPTTEELWHCHAEGILMVALTNMSLPQEAW